MFAVEMGKWIVSALKAISNIVIIVLGTEWLNVPVVTEPV
jgi:hypothetical protein